MCSIMTILMHAVHALLCRFTMSIAVELPDTAAREDIIMTHLRQHCEQHVLGAGAVDAHLMQVQLLQSSEASVIISLYTILSFHNILTNPQTLALGIRVYGPVLLQASSISCSGMLWSGVQTVCPVLFSEGLPSACCVSQRTFLSLNNCLQQ